MKKVTAMLMLTRLVKEAGHRSGFHRHMCHLHQKHVVCSQ